jgi:P-type E1-E2 ATPase
VQDVSEFPGRGLTGHIEGHVITLTGRANISPEIATLLPAISPGLECIVVVDDQLAALLKFHDQPRSDSKFFLQHLDSRHRISEIVLLSGDRPAEVSQFAESMGITRVYGGMTPEQKVAVVQEITTRNPTLYLGDGINDAPAMMSATVGIALGVYSEITSEAAGAVVLQASLTGVDELIHIGRRMHRIAMTSAVGGMVLSIVGMGAAAGGYLSPIQGALLQEGIDLVSILNSLRMILPTRSLSDIPCGAEQGERTEETSN